MNHDKIIQHIVLWLKNNLKSSGCSGFVVGVSGGIDSALTSTLAAKTNHDVVLLNMPINQAEDQFSRSNEQIQWLKESYKNVRSYTIDLTSTFNTFCECSDEIKPSLLSKANSASRLRMTALYSVANTNNLLVTGTGNKVEDYGIGFFTKYGDGGVDISPIADLLKSEVYSLAKFLGIPQTIQDASPTDGLWDDDRSDEDQIGASYDELEWALERYDNYGFNNDGLSPRQKEVLKIYTQRHIATKHKLLLPPVCEISEDLKK